MYVKLYAKILDSSIAEDRRLRHFFIDLLLLADPDGIVGMTKQAIAKRTGAEMEEVEWGLAELMKPEKGVTGHLDNDGRRIEPLEGQGYGWQILNYKLYRDLKTAKELREANAERVRRYREKIKAQQPTSPPAPKVSRKKPPEKTQSNSERSVKNWDSYVGAGAKAMDSSPNLPAPVASEPDQSSNPADF